MRNLNRKTQIKKLKKPKHNPITINNLKNKKLIQLKPNQQPRVKKENKMKSKLKVLKTKQNQRRNKKRRK